MDEESALQPTAQQPVPTKPAEKKGGFFRRFLRGVSDYIGGALSLIYSVPYGLYKVGVGLYHTAKRNWNEASYNFTAGLTSIFTPYLFTTYKMLKGSYKIATDKALPWENKCDYTCKLYGYHDHS